MTRRKSAVGLAYGGLVHAIIAVVPFPLVVALITAALFVKRLSPCWWHGCICFFFVLRVDHYYHFTCQSSGLGFEDEELVRNTMITIAWYCLSLLLLLYTLIVGDCYIELRIDTCRPIRNWKKKKTRVVRHRSIRFWACLFRWLLRCALCWCCAILFFSTPLPEGECVEKAKASPTWETTSKTKSQLIRSSIFIIR